MADGVQTRSQRRKRAGSWMDGSHTQEKNTNGVTAGGGVESRIRRKFVAKTKHSAAAASAGAGGGAGAATGARQASSTAAARATKPSAQDDAGSSSSSSVVQPGPRKRARRRVAPEHRAALSMLSHMPQMTGQFSTARTKAKLTLCMSALMNLSSFTQNTARAKTQRVWRHIHCRCGAWSIECHAGGFSGEGRHSYR